MYSCRNWFLPPRFNNNFSQSNQFHSYNTRNSQAYRLPYCRTNTKKFSPFFQGPKFFNSLDNEVVNSQSLSSFKKKLTIKLLSMKAVHKSFHLRLFAIFSAIDVKQLYPVARGSLTSHKLFMLLTLSNIMRHSQVYSRRYCGLVLTYLHFKRPIYSCVQSTLACAA